MRYELIMWLYQPVKYLPGRLGAWIRNLVMPYQRRGVVYVMDGVQIDKPSLLSFGNNVSVNRGCVINAGGGVDIGDNVLIGPNVIIYSQNHEYREPGRPFCEQGYVLKRTVIGSNVWLASSCIVLPGVVIGDNVVVAAGAVVTNSVPNDVVVAGNPARVIKNLRT